MCGVGSHTCPALLILSCASFLPWLPPNSTDYRCWILTGLILHASNLPSVFSHGINTDQCFESRLVALKIYYAAWCVISFPLVQSPSLPACWNKWNNPQCMMFVWPSLLSQLQMLSLLFSLPSQATPQPHTPKKRKMNAASIVVELWGRIYATLQLWYFSYTVRQQWLLLISRVWYFPVISALWALLLQPVHVYNIIIPGIHLGRIMTFEPKVLCLQVVIFIP